MQGLQFTLKVPFECAFTQQGAVNTLPTYDIPPLTTIRGLIFNALCRPSLLNQDHHTRRDFLEKEQVNEEYEFRKEFEKNSQIGIEVKESGIKKSDLRSRKKQVGTDKSSHGVLSYVTQMETIISPTYEITLLHNDVDFLQTIKKRLVSPPRPLYLGHSDHLVTVKDTKVTEYSYVDQSIKSDTIVTPTSSGDTTNILPIEIEDMSGHSADTGRVKMVSYGNAETTGYYQSPDNHKVVPLD